MAASSNPASYGGQTGRKVARYHKNRRAIASSTPSKPFYTNPTLAGVGSGPGSGVGPGTVLTVNFDMAVSVRVGAGQPLPGWTDITDTVPLTVVSVVQVNATEVALTFSGTIQPGDLIQIPDTDPCIRTSTGGFVQPGIYPAP